MKKIQAISLSGALIFLILFNIGIGLDTKNLTTCITTLGVNFAFAQEASEDNDGYPSGKKCTQLTCTISCGIAPYVVNYDGTYFGCVDTDARGECDVRRCNTNCSATCMGH